MSLKEARSTAHVQDDAPNGMENCQAPQRTNHVSSVLLYGVPIVSLYIEGKERLCLAQISNTLLKQFSYNEIHNRRVALGITCVQCTPVQLEILRRAGAMPVSSRRCGMITRREAERLCKSFLGDNTPPRLPDDFAFNVQHKCAWGCRGSFLPSRYNSSRAKCIKCSYCGMFFSPNKFIFHSHRITTTDRYVQPDAANFNSWRRHMTLSGNSYDEKIIHAWEDVKAMFNGGTRKRLISSSKFGNRHLNSPSSMPPENCGVGSISNKSPIQFETEPKSLSSEESTMPERSFDNQYKYSTVAAAAAAVVGVTAVAAATVGVPFNIHRSSVLSPLHSLRNDHDLSLMPMSRNFVVDYMWQQKDQHIQQQFSKKTSGDNHVDSKLQLEACPKSWVKSDVNVPLPNVRLSDNQIFNLKNESPAPICGILKNHNLSGIGNNGIDISEYNIPSLLNCSAFKPVVASAAIVSTSFYTRSSESTRNIYIQPTQSTPTTTFLTHSNITPTLHQSSVSFEEHSSILDTLESNKEKVESTNAVTAVPQINTNIYEKSCVLSSGYTNDHEDDDEVVDIETTEDEEKSLFEQINAPGTNDILSESECTILSQTTSTNIDMDADVDVDGVTTDDTEDQLEVSIWQSEEIKISTPSHTESEFDRKRLNNTDTKAFDGHLKIVTRRKSSKTLLERKVSKNNSKVISEKLYSKSKAASEQPPGLQKRVAFPVFVKSKLHSYRPHQTRQFCPNSLTESHKWNYPVGNIGPLYCFDTTVSENLVDFK
ncbi:hypothetical protein KR018_006621 [Drosophila ironensis]|nr:hypothetical protein KR018_006621 [Drosophila ironensis]